MKSFIVALIVGLSLITYPVFGSEIDLTSMGSEELIQLRESINQELASRGEEGASVGSGVFVAGVDIKPGMYKIQNTYEGWSNVYVYKSIEDLEKEEYSDSHEYAFIHEAPFDDDSCNVSLEDGQILVIVGSGIIYPFSPSWAP